MLEEVLFPGSGGKTAETSSAPGPGNCKEGSKNNQVGLINLLSFSNLYDFTVLHWCSLIKTIDFH